MSIFKFCSRNGCAIRYLHGHCQYSGCDHINQPRQVHETYCSMSPINIDRSSYYTDKSIDCYCSTDYITPFHAHCLKDGCERTDSHTHCYHNDCLLTDLHIHCGYPGCDWTGINYLTHKHCKVANCNITTSLHSHCRTCGNGYDGYHKHCKKNGCNRVDKHKHCTTCDHVSNIGEYHRHCIACDRTDKHKHCLKCKDVKDVGHEC